MSFAAADAEAARRAATPALGRRMASFVYEAMMLFGVGLVPGAIGAVFVRLLGAEAAWHVEGTLRAIAFVVYGVYFVWFWSRSGQTLPMQTWRIRVVTRGGAALTQRRALARYLLACAWLLPGWLAGTLAGWRGWPMLAAVGANVVVYAGLALARRDRQFWHDAACGTRLVVWQPPRTAGSQPLAASPR
jgi:uncharacterized RDD family membrane protein YckC